MITFLISKSILPVHSKSVFELAIISMSPIECSITPIIAITYIDLTISVDDDVVANCPNTTIFIVSNVDLSITVNFDGSTVSLIVV